MKGAMIGNLVGVPYEFVQNRDKDFQMYLAGPSDFMDDDSLLTLATAHAILRGVPYEIAYADFCDKYPDLPYGAKFRNWMNSIELEPYNSKGNGSAMRVSPIGFYYTNHHECLRQAEKSSAVTHNHPEGIKAAVFTADAVHQLYHSKLSKVGFAGLAYKYRYPYRLGADQLRKTYQYSELATPTILGAIACFLSSTDFEDAIRNACSIGGDADTLAAIVGAWAEAYYGIPPKFEAALSRFPSFAIELTEEFYSAL